MAIITKRTCFFPLFFIIFFIVGCGQPPLKGNVTFEDGSPLTSGMVVFDNGASMSRAPIQSDGTFIVGTNKEKDGISPGTYRVYITGAIEMLDNPSGRFPAPSRPLIHSKYSSADTSGLSVTIDKSMSEWNITVEPPK